VRIADNTLGKPGKIVVDGDWLEVRPSDLTGDQVQVVYEIAPHLAPHAPAPAKPPKPISSRDLEIYRLHEVPVQFGGTEEERTIPSLAKEYGLKAKTVWGICTKIRKVMQADEAFL
jgi:hypothetical protein